MTLLKINFKRLISDPYVYVKMNEENEIIFILGAYIYDIL